MNPCPGGLSESRELPICAACQIVANKYLTKKCQHGRNSEECVAPQGNGGKEEPSSKAVKVSWRRTGRLIRLSAVQGPTEVVDFLSPFT